MFSEHNGIKPELVTESYKIPKCLEIEQLTLKYNVGSEKSLKIDFKIL